MKLKNIVYKRSIVMSLLFLITTFICTIPLLYANTSSAQFLLIPQDARSESIGRTTVSHSYDASATYWNPAGLTFSSRMKLLLTNIRFPTDIFDNYISMLVPFGKYALGIDYTSFSTKIISYNEAGAALDGGALTTAERSSNYRISIARKFGKKLSIGYSLGYSDMRLFYDTTKLDGTHAAALLHNLGMIYKTKRFAWGCSVYNILQEGIKFDDDEKEPLPQILRCGVSYHLLKKQNLLLLTSYENIIREKNMTTIGIGTEYSLFNRLLLRNGYRIQKDGINTPSCGFGIRYGHMLFDYAYTLPPSNTPAFDFHRFSFSYNFSLNKKVSTTHSPPRIVIQYFKDNKQTLEPKNQKVYTETIGMSGLAMSDKNTLIDRIIIYLNGKVISKQLAVDQEIYQINTNITLNQGKNYLTIEAVDAKDEKNKSETIILIYEKDILKGSASITDFISQHLSLGQKKWAVLIGIEEYSKNSGFERLDYVGNDVLNFKKCLLENLENFSEERIFTLGKTTVDPHDKSTYVGKATKYNIEKFIGDDLPKKVSENDTVLIFFSGHGLTLDVHDGNIKKKQGFLVPIDGKKESPFATCVSMDAISQLSELIPAKQILFVIDACNSGIVLTRNKGDIPNKDIDCLIESFSGRSRQAITAGKSYQVSSISSKYNQSIYTYYIVKGLEGAADSNSDTIVSIHELHDYVRRKVSQESENQQIPQMGRLKQGGEGDFFFILKTEM